MLELFQQLSDDQTALLGCGAAMLGAMFMLTLSFHANPRNRKSLPEASTNGQQESENLDENRPRRAA